MGRVVSNKQGWGWRVERAWRRGRLPAVAWLVAAVASVAVLGAVAWRLQQLDGEQARLTAAVQQARADRHRLRRPTQSAAPEPDFAAMLPREADGADVLRRLQALCTTQGVSLGNVDITTTGPTAENLGKVALRGVLTGSYVQTKRVLADLLSQLPGAALESARWRPGDANRPAEMNLSLTVWSAPLVGSAGTTASREVRQ
jgi:hypothetical protein